MRPRRLRRLPHFDYSGFARYFLTICTDKKLPYFARDDVAAYVREQILRTSDQQAYEVLAYCIMPNHVHMLVEGGHRSSPLPDFVGAFKQRTGFHAKRMLGRPLWQAGYYEHVLRASEDSLRVIRYILDNPVRRGLVASAVDYPWSGSGQYGVRELIDLVQSSGTRPG